MKVDIPVKNANGEYQYTHTVDEKQMQALLGFALNFLLATGLATAYGIDDQSPDDGQQELEFDD